jgi:hypothetical protein
MESQRTTTRTNSKRQVNIKNKKLSGLFMLNANAKFYFNCSVYLAASFCSNSWNTGLEMHYLIQLHRYICLLLSWLIIQYTYIYIFVPYRKVLIFLGINWLVYCIAGKQIQRHWRQTYKKIMTKSQILMTFCYWNRRCSKKNKSTMPNVYWK